MYTTVLATLFAFSIALIHACNPDTPGCDHPGNFTGALTPFVDANTAHCQPGNQSAIFANIPSTFYNPPDEAPCNAPINITHPTTKKQITATVIGSCNTCRANNIQLTTAGLIALSPNGRLSRAPTRVNWTFVVDEDDGSDD